MNAANPRLLGNPALRLMLFGGKGGCGKTTSAAAASICLARQRPGKKVLLASTDPAHSLGDSFERKVGGEFVKVGEVPNLCLLEMDAGKLFGDFTKRYEGVMKGLAERGTYLDRDDIDCFFSHPLPGMDEVMAVIEVARILKCGEFDLVVLDTAPTGHTLRMLPLPVQMKKWVEVLDRMQEKHRLLRKRFGGRHVRDEAEEFLTMMADDLDRVEFFLKNGQTTEFIPVTIPEPAAIEETGRLITSLKECGITVRSIVVNRVVEKRHCSFCSSRKEELDKCLEEIEERFSGFDLAFVPLFPDEIHGLESLSQFAEFLFTRKEISAPAGEYLVSSSGSPACPNATFHEVVSGISVKPGLEFLFFGGKGGVGKTTMAASTALCIARENPMRKVLILSTDPAHSLSDCFGRRIGNSVTPILESGAEGHLYALEMDAPQMFDILRNKYCSDIEEVFTPFVGGENDIAFDREVVRGLLELSPPGLDEIMALKKLLELRGSYDLFVIDTAPTGHALRFLEIPEIAMGWLKSVLRLLLKYKAVVRLGCAAEGMMNLLRDMKRVKEALADSRKTEFIAVTIPESLGVLETERLLRGVKGLGVHVGHIIVNMMMPAMGCCFCASIREKQEGYLRQVMAKWGDEYSVTAVPLLPYPAKGLRALGMICEGSETDALKSGRA